MNRADTNNDKTLITQVIKMRSGLDVCSECQPHSYPWLPSDGHPVGAGKEGDKGHLDKNSGKRDEGTAMDLRILEKHSN